VKKDGRKYHCTWRWGKTKKNQISLLFLSISAMFSSSMSMTPIEKPNIDVKNSRVDLSNEINEIYTLIDA
jgi:hypothetical protein